MVTYREAIVSLSSSICFLVTQFVSYSQPAPVPIGMWREHLPYKSVIDVTGGDGKVFAATSYSLFVIDSDENTIGRMSRMTGLSETGIACIFYDAAHHKLLVAYKSSNIDIIRENDIVNIPDVKRDNIVGDKTINDIYRINADYYLSTGLGVIVINGDKNEVRQTWFIGSAGGKIRVGGFTTDSGYYYAATAEGLKKASLGVANPENHLNWQSLAGINGLPAGPCKDVVTVENKVMALFGDSIFTSDGNAWNLFFFQTGWKITGINSSSGKLLICQQHADSNARVTVINPDGSVSVVIRQSELIADPRKAMILQNNHWVADSIGGLSKYDLSGFENYQLNSPQSIATGDLLFHGETFYAAAGTVSDTWNIQGNRDGMYKLENGKWTNYNYRSFPALDSVNDLIALAIDRTNASVWAGSFGKGLLQIRPGNTFGFFSQNSGLGPAIFDPGSYRVSGLAFDSDNHLWISNYGAARPVVVKKADGNWKNFAVPYSLVENAVSQVLIDDNNQKWIVSPRGNGLIVFNHGSTIDDEGDDRWKLFRFGNGAGNLPSNNVNCLAKDKNGFIWIGTDNGIGIVQCPGLVFSGQGCDAILPVVLQGNFNGYLFRGEQVQAISVDGADRKWIATKRGAWLIGPEGDRVIYHFTEENSLLLGNDVRRIAIDGNTGEVYFATAKGICSFRSTATEGTASNENVIVFPNPVPPNHRGPIAIRGLVNNAIVKITELDGRLVFQTRALGGQAVWDGRDYKGRKISTGVYLVFVTDDKRKENFAAKIVFISQ